MTCFSCGGEVEITARVGRSERCPHCGSDLHCCRNCSFYDRAAYNECRETQAERVVEKERENFCDYFEAAVGRTVVRQKDPAAEAKKKWKTLFKK